MSSPTTQLPDGFEVVRLLSENPLFSTVLARDATAKGPESLAYVFRVFDRSVRRNPTVADSIHEFYGRYQQVTNFSHLPRVYSVTGGLGGVLFVREEYVDGTPLSDFLTRDKNLSPIPLLEQICEALHTSHQKQVYHLCISPSKVLVCGNELKIKLVGFGYAAVVEELSTLALKTTQRHMAPEILRGRPAHSSADVYSLGIMIQDLFPEFRTHPQILKAVSPNPGERFSKARLFETELEGMFAVRPEGESHDGPRGERGPVPRTNRGGLVPKTTITTDPPGARVTIDGRAVGATGPSGLAVSWKQGDLAVDKDGYEGVCIPYRDRLGHAEIHLDLKPLMVPLRILTEPLGVYVTVDGTDQGVTSSPGLQLHVPLGKRSIALSKPGYHTKTATVELKELRSTKMSVRLLTQPVRLATDPTGATVSIGSRVIGTTDSEGLYVPWNEGPVVIEKQGHERVTRSFDSPPAAMRVNVKLTSSLVPVTIFTKPHGARITVDGQDFGETTPDGLKVGLAPGSRTITANKAGYQSDGLVISVAGGAPIVLEPLVLRAIPAKAPDTARTFESAVSWAKSAYDFFAHSAKQRKRLKLSGYFFLVLCFLIVSWWGFTGPEVPRSYPKDPAGLLRIAQRGDPIAQYNLGVYYGKGLGVPKDHSEAVKWYRKAADQGLAGAQYNLGVCYGNGQGVPKDHSEAVKWYRKAADQGLAGAQYNLGVCYGNGQGVPKDHSEAVKWYRKAADQGLAGAQYNLGVCYGNGQGVPKDHSEAVKWYRKAADQGLAGAQYNLGVCYGNGQGVPKDHSEAVKWYRKAADQGEALAQLNLGVCYAQGQGVPQNYTEAVKWTRKAAEKGDAQAQLNLGVCYAQGQGVPQDDSEAVKWVRKAADQGLAGAQYNLGVYYGKGLGVPQDHSEAVKWYRKAADQGLAGAQYNLGVRYGNGQGVPKDHSEAVKWYRKAADQGLAGAQYNLGVCYGNGQGVPQNYTEAVKWTRKAAEKGDAQAQYNLAVCYAQGQGVPKDHSEAVKWYRKAADQGEALAQLNLGVCYAQGQGVPQNYTEAVKWTRKAAEKGDAQAQYNLAVCYAQGQGVPQDDSEAVKWVRKAADQGHAEAKSTLSKMGLR